MIQAKECNDKWKIKKNDIRNAFALRVNRL